MLLHKLLLLVVSDSDDDREIEQRSDPGICMTLVRDYGIFALLFNTGTQFS